MLFVLAYIAGTSLLFFLAVSAHRAFERKEKSEEEPVDNRIIKSHDLWMNELHMALDNMTLESPTIVIPGNYHERQPVLRVRNPNIPIRQPHGNDGRGFIRDNMGNIKVYGKEDYWREPTRHPTKRPKSNIELQTPNYKTWEQHQYDKNSDISYKKECEKCLQFLCTQPKQRFCEVCAKQQLELPKATPKQKNYLQDGHGNTVATSDGAIFDGISHLYYEVFQCVRHPEMKYGIKYFEEGDKERDKYGEQFKCPRCEKSLMGEEDKHWVELMKLTKRRLQGIALQKKLPVKSAMNKAEIIKMIVDYDVFHKYLGQIPRSDHNLMLGSTRQEPLKLRARL